jgi:hypothetical protein
MSRSRNEAELSETSLANYSAIDSAKIIATIELLEGRIEERFPKSGLRQVCAHLLTVAENMKQRSEWIARPVGWLRLLTYTICVLIVIGTIAALFTFGMNHDDLDLLPKKNQKSITNFITVMEASINDVVLIGAAIFFLLTFETRYKRNRALKALHELRSVAHIIDMHQLTKDPHRISEGEYVYARGRMSPKMEMTSFELRRYLDYCSELLSLTGKIAAVYVQAFDDGVAIASASELEALTSGLSHKIWQKILILEKTEDERPHQKAATDPKTASESKSPQAKPTNDPSPEPESDEAG